MNFDRLEQDGPWAVIPAHSERQAMDWSLVLASQDIPTSIQKSQAGEWVLLVEKNDFDRASHSIRQYQSENRRWNWRPHVLWPETGFDWRALFWCFGLILSYLLVALHYPYFRFQAMMDSEAVANGEWWRLFTAVFLHADLAHLMANVVFGFLLLGFAMAHYGAGVGLFSAFLAGAAGNGLGLFLYPEDYLGVGASGMVMGGLGLMTVQSISYWRQKHLPGILVIRSLLAGLLLFVLLGLDPTSDVLAHLGGFVAGLGLGAAWHLFSPRVIRSKKVNGLAWVFLCGWVALVLYLAITDRNLEPAPNPQSGRITAQF